MEEIIIRNSIPEDAERIGEIFDQQWTAINQNYKNLIGDELYEIFYGDLKVRMEGNVKMIKERSLDSKTCFVTLVDGVVAGFATYRVTESPGGLTGILGFNGVDNAYKGRGIAGRQYALIFDKMREDGCVAAMVHTGLDDMHAPARRAYEKAGFKAFLPDVNYFMMLDENTLTYKNEDKDIVIRNVRPEDEERIMEISREQWTVINSNYKDLIGDELYGIFRGTVEEKVETLQGELRDRMKTPEHFIVTELDGYVVGFASYRTVDAYGYTHGVVGYNALDNRFKGRGIAGRQYALIYEKMREAGCISTMVHTGLDEMHAPARRAYEKSGFSANLPSITYYMKL